jgi:hypothetical protein
VEIDKQWGRTNWKGISASSGTSLQPAQARIHRRCDRRKCLSEKGSSGATATSTVSYLSARAAKSGRRSCLNVNYAVSKHLAHYSPKDDIPNGGGGGGGEIFGCDAVVAAAMIDRLVHHPEIISLRGSSYRLKDKEELADAVAKRLEIHRKVVHFYFVDNTGAARRHPKPRSSRERFHEVPTQIPY